MAEFDLAIRGGTVVTASDTVRADIGVRAGRIVAVGGTDRACRAGDRCRRPAGAARRDRQPRAYRPGLGARHRDGRRFRLGHPGGGGRRQHLRDALRRPAAWRLAAGRRGRLPGQGRGAMPHRCGDPHDRLGSERAGARPGTAGAGGRRLHLVQGLHDLRRPRAERPPAAGGLRPGEARGRAGDGACGGLRRDPLPRRAPGAGRRDGALRPRPLPAPSGRARGGAPGDQPRRADRPADRDRARLGRGGDGAGRLGAGARPEDPRGDLPAIPDPDRRRHEGAGLGRPHGRGEVRVLAAAPRRREPGGGLVGDRPRDLRRGLLRPTARSATTTRRAS